MKPTALRLDRLETRLAPAVSTWDGGGADNHWTTAANWVGDVAPQPGDDLVFPSGAAQLANVNDFPAGTAIHSIAIGDQTFAPRYQLSGNAIALAAGLTFKSVSPIVHQIGMPYHWAYSGISTGDSANDLLGIVLDPNTHIQESKASTCDIRPGRRPRGPEMLELVESYRRRAGVPSGRVGVNGRAPVEASTGEGETGS